jgi:hypothetical protein
VTAAPTIPRVRTAHPPNQRQTRPFATILALAPPSRPTGSAAVSWLSRTCRAHGLRSPTPRRARGLGSGGASRGTACRRRWRRAAVHESAHAAQLDRDTGRLGASSAGRSWTPEDCDRPTMPAVDFVAETGFGDDGCRASPSSDKRERLQASTHRAHLHRPVLASNEGATGTRRALRPCCLPCRGAVIGRPDRPGA